VNGDSLNLGRYIQSSVTPTANDQFIAFSVLTAPPTHHIYINAIDAFGGDTNQTLSLFQIPTNALGPNSEPKAGDIIGAIQICNQGGYALTQPVTQTDAQQRVCATGADAGRGNTQLTMPLAILPAGYSLIVSSMQNFSNPFTVNAGGFMVKVDA